MKHRNLGFFPSPSNLQGLSNPQFRSMDEEIDPTYSLNPPPSSEQQPSTSELCEAAGFQLPDQCDVVSPEVGQRIPSQDVVSDEKMADERGADLMGGKSLEAVEVSFEDESVVKDETGGSLQAGKVLPLGENRNSCNDETGVEVVHYKDGESENVKEVPAIGENRGEQVVCASERKDNCHDNLEVEELNGAPELSIEWVGEAGKIENKTEERTEVVEIHVPRHLSDMTEVKCEPNCVCEENVVLKQDDGLKEENEALIVDSSDLKGVGSQILCSHSVRGELSRKSIGWKELREEEMDDYNLQLNGNAEAKGQEDPAQMDENAQSPFVGEKEEVARQELSQEDADDFRLTGDVELQEEDKLAQTDEILRSPLHTDQDKDNGGEDNAQEINDPLSVASPDVVGGEDGAAVGITLMETEGEAETRAEGSKRGSGAKWKRGVADKVSGKTSKVLVEEDVCFVCLDGGDLVLCDRRGCPKAYHPSCVDRDEAFFQEKGRWTCGWHLCSKCEKNAYYMCCTCPFSLCKGCIKSAVIFCLRGNKGLCEACIKTVMLIENNVQGDDMAAFDDKSQWEYLFKDYWIEQKENLSFTAEEIAQAKNPWRGFDVDEKQGTPGGKFQASNVAANASNSSLADAEVINVKRKKIKKQIRLGNEVGSDTYSSLVVPDGSNTKRKAKRWLKPLAEGADSDSDNPTRNGERAVTRSKKNKKLGNSHANDGVLMNQLSERGTSSQGNTEWASKELLELVLHMKNGDCSVLSQFDVQELLLAYIKRYKLRDPQRRSQIVCDPMLEKLFGKPRVGHFEMLKLLESHFLVKDDSQQGSVVDTEVSQMEFYENASAFIGQKKHKKGVGRGLQSNLDDYSAVDMHNMTLIYLRRNLMEALLKDSKRFREKVVGSFVRIRISGSMQKQDMYRLVQVVGTGKAAEPYKVGKLVTDVMLEILNLDKNELVSIDAISNQEFTEDECKRLRQSFKCGLASRLTVGEVLEKAKELHQVRVTDWIETEIVRLRHLCDRASDLGHKRELRENVQKLQLLKKPEERQRRLDEVPMVHADPKMDPTYVSDDESEMLNERKDINMRRTESVPLRKATDQFSAGRGYSSNESWSPTAMPSNRSMELSRNLSGRGFSGRTEDASPVGETANRSLCNQGVDRGTPQSNNWEKSSASAADSRSGNFTDSGFRNNASPSCRPQPSPHPSVMVSQVDVKISEADKLWHYQDPTGKVQGPFSMVQLHKWNASGFFPVDLRIWKTTETIDDSILLTSALAGKFQKEPSVVSAGPSDTMVTGTSHILPANTGKPHESVLQPKSSPVFPAAQSQQVTSSLPDLSSRGSTAPSLMVAPKLSAGIHSSNSGSRQDSSNLLSPTPSKGSVASARKRNSVSRWSPAIYTNQSSSDVIEIIPSRGNGMPLSTNTVCSEARQIMRSADPPSSEPSTGSVASSHALTNGQQMSSQTAAIVGEAQKVQVTTQYPLLSQNAATLLMNAVQGVQNLEQTAAVQSSPLKDSGSGSAVRPETVNPSQMPGNSQSWLNAGMQNNANMVQAQEPGYGYWINAPVRCGSGQFQGAANFPNQNLSGIPSQIQWNPINTPWGMAAPQILGAPPISNTVCGSMPGNPNMGWVMAAPGMAVGPTVAAPLPGQVAQQPGHLASAPPRSASVCWPAKGNANTGWVAPTRNPSAWGSEQNLSLNK